MAPSHRRDAYLSTFGKDNVDVATGAGLAPGPRVSTQAHWLEDAAQRRWRRHPSPILVNIGTLARQARLAAIHPCFRQHKRVRLLVAYFVNIGKP